MSKRSAFFIGIIFLFSACHLQGVKSEKDKTDSLATQGKTYEELKGVKDSVYRNPDLLAKKAPKTSTDYPNGIKIKWFKHGNGVALQDGHVYMIDYEVLLTDGTVIDGSKLINRKWVHFLLGYQMEMKGWDFALEHMKIGDFCEVFIPSNLARGKVGIPGLVPPDADNILKIKILGEIPPTRTVDGTQIWVLAEAKKFKDSVADANSEIAFNYVVGTPSNPRFVNSRYKNSPYIYKSSDRGIVKGLKKALIGVKKNDRLWIIVPPDQAYGKKGMLNEVKPNEPVFYDLTILQVKNPHVLREVTKK